MDKSCVIPYNLMMRPLGWEQIAAINSGPRSDRGQELSGRIVDGRFRIGALANIGGMGFVYAADDLATGGARVAFKVMLPISREGDSARDRFFREAEVLSALQHPGIVRYIAHGMTDDERPYLAMEWLTGEELEKTLGNHPLSVDDSLVLLRKIGDALAFAHERGITHRDLKPSNIILRNGRVDDPAILDFGVARWLGHTMQVTRTGMLVGTPGYMAPEQARGQTDIGPAADVFALGCLLYQCLMGKPPFTGDHITAVLAKVLFEEVQSLRVHRPDMPPALDTFTCRLLQKNPAQRPRNARVLLDELDGITATMSRSSHVSATLPKLTLSNRELSLFSLVLAAPERGDDSDTWVVSNSTIRAPFLTETNWPRETLEKLGVHLESMADGSIAIVVGKGASAKEQAATAARCALLLIEQNPKAQIILATGRGAVDPTSGVPQGEVIEHASALMRRRAVANILEPHPAGIWIDEITASVLGPEYALDRGTSAIVLTNVVNSTRHGANSPAAPTCIGRDRELGLLLSTLDAVIEEEQSAATMVTSVPGMGKSRLLSTFLERVSQDRSNVSVLYAAGDPSHAHSPYGIIRQALHERAGIGADDDQAERRRKLQAYLFANTSATDRPTALVELFSKQGDDATLPSADAVVDAAWLSWIKAECAVQPMLLVVDDVHWADEASLHLFDQLLRTAPNVPLFLLTIHRLAGEGIVRVPWQDRAQELRLSSIGKRAAERFVRQSLGNEASPETIARVVREAAGIPLFLEELMRAERADDRTVAAQTLLTILQARIQHLSTDSRRVLRAASLFGHTFWRRGIAYVLGMDPGHEGEKLARSLEELQDAELIVLHPESRYADDTEFGFSTEHVRDAAFGLLTNEDRELGRSLVDRFLDQVG